MTGQPLWHIRKHGTQWRIFQCSAAELKFSPIAKVPCCRCVNLTAHDRATKPKTITTPIIS